MLSQEPKPNDRVSTAIPTTPKVATKPTVSSAPTDNARATANPRRERSPRNIARWAGSRANPPQPGRRRWTPA